MKIIRRFLAAILLMCLLGGCTAAPGTVQGDPAEYQDPGLDIRLNLQSDTLKQEVTVHTFVDGDTTHFNVPEQVDPSGVLKVRYLAINTPESTGKIEEYGKAASRYTRERLSAATSIIIESDDGKWNLDSTGERRLVWVWYKTAEDADYQNLNVDLLLKGLAIANSAGKTRYGSACMMATTQAQLNKLGVFSGQKDPDFYYGDAIELTLRELRCNLAQYEGKKVAFSGVITMNSNNSVYVEACDPETGLYFGIPVYYGYNLSGSGLDILQVGNESRIVGTVQYYEAGDSWQVSGLSYRMMKPDDPSNIQLISQGHSAAYVPTLPETFAKGKVDMKDESGAVVSHDYAALALATTLEMKGLTVTQVDDSDEDGELTLLCEAGEVSVNVRTAALRNADGGLLTAEDFLGKTIDVRGIAETYDGAYQIRVFMLNGITIHD